MCGEILSSDWFLVSVQFEFFSNCLS
jgi:hypothetical protein